MKKVLIVNSLYYPDITGGAEISTQLLAEGLLKKGLEPVIITTSGRNYQGFVNGVKVYYMKYSNLYWFNKSKYKTRIIKPFWNILDIFNPFIFKKIARIISIEQPDLVHTNNLLGISVSAWIAAKKYDLPVLHTVRDYYLMCIKSNMYSNGKNCGKKCISCKIFTFFKRILSNKVDKIVGISNFILEAHTGNGYFRNISKEVIYNPIIKNIKRKKETNKNSINFSYVGALAESKGIEFLLKSFKKSQIDNNLHIYGEGRNIKYANYLKKRYKSKNIIFHGFTDNNKIFDSTDVVIVPSLWNEPFSRVIIEAYSYGIPVIASKRGGIPEIVENALTGYLFEPSIKGDLASKIKDISEDPSIIKQMSKNCLRKLSEFQIDKIAESYINVYEKLIAKI